MNKKLLLLFLVGFSFLVHTQEDAWVYLTDKEDVLASIADPITILTQDAIDRKVNHGVVIDARDVPVNEAYIAQLKLETGITVMAKSKWFNAIHVRGSETNINNLTLLGFVDYIDFADDTLDTSKMGKSKSKDDIEEVLVDFNYGFTQNQVEMINADGLHADDYTGEGVVVAVIDAGFPNVNTMLAFQRLRDLGKLLNGYDFVDRTADVYASTMSDHGTQVLSTMAAYGDNLYIGTAPDASYYLFRTEDAASENPVEESYWVEAAERADSLGVDVINTSLGYKEFDNPNYDYSSTDMDGNTAFISRGANIAFEKGMLLVNSAGNSGALGITAPADAAGVFTIGAVDAAGDYATFSSQGSAIQPTLKPDVVAQGQLAFVVDKDDFIVQSNGTSFSSPIMAGGMASLLQAAPNKTNAEIMQVVRESASQYTTPDYFLGYGIPDLHIALSVLSVDTNSIAAFKLISNPVSDLLSFHFPEAFQLVSVQIYDVMGKKVMTTKMTSDNKTIDVTSLVNGPYIAVLTEGVSRNVIKFIKE